MLSLADMAFDNKNNPIANLTRREQEIPPMLSFSCIPQIIKSDWL